MVSYVIPKVTTKKTTSKHRREEAIRKVLKLS